MFTSNKIRDYSDLMHRAADVIVRDGWRQHAYHDTVVPYQSNADYDRTRATNGLAQGSHCLLGAMIRALAESRGRKGPATEVDLVRQFPAISTSRVSGRNDAMISDADEAVSWLVAHAQATASMGMAVGTIA